MLLRVTLIRPVTRHPKFPPERPIFHHHNRVLTRQDEKLRSDPEVVERHFRQHRVAATSHVPLPQSRILEDDLDEALVTEPNVAVRGGGGGAIERGGGDEGVVDVVEGVKGDAVLGEEGEEGVGGVVEDGSGEEATCGGDECRGRAEGDLRGNEFGGVEYGVGAATWKGDVGGGVRVDIDVVEWVAAAVWLGEEAGPERGEMEVGVGEEEEGDFEFRVRGGEAGAGKRGGGRRGSAREEG